MAGDSRSEDRVRPRLAGASALLRGMIRRRWGLMGITVAVLAVTVWEFALSVPTDWPMWVLATLHVVAVACVPFVPLSASAVVLIVGVASSLVPYQGGPSQLWGAMLALGVIGMMRRPVVTVAAWALAIGAQAVQTFVLHSPVVDESGFPFFVLCFAFAAAVGYAVRLHLETVATRERRLRTEALLGRMQVALQLHDDVVNDLAVAAHFAQRRMRHAGDDGERNAWDEENRKILRALDHVHAIIDATAIIERDDASEPSAAAFERLLRDALARERRYLDRAGLKAEMRLSGQIRRSVGPVVRREALALLHELCRNAVRHTPSGAVFCLSVHCGADAVEITELCRWKDGDGMSDESQSDGRFNGQGLQAHRRMIRNLGGELTWNRDADTWQCYARIPLVSAFSM